MSNRALTLLAIFFLLVFAAFSTLYVVYEGQHALVQRLGKLETQNGKVVVSAPGIHVKVPFITHALKFDTRLQTLNADASRILTDEQKFVLVDYYAKWRIADLPLYYKRTGGYAPRAQELLKQKINEALRAAIGKRALKDIIATERLKLMEQLQLSANISAKELGIKVTDVRIVGIELPQEVRESVYSRMRVGREQEATKLRAQGQATAETMRAKADEDVAVQLADAQMQAQKIRATGDAEAGQIYLKAYSRDPKFYSLYRSLEAYRQVFVNKHSVMVLRPDSEFFRYFRGSTGHAASHKP